MKKTAVIVLALLVVAAIANVAFLTWVGWKTLSAVDRLADRAVAQISGPPWTGQQRPNRTTTTATTAGYLGVQVTELTPELRRHFGSPEDRGVLVAAVNGGGPADRAGLEVGDVLVSVDARPVSSTAQLRSALRRSAGESVEVEIVREGDRRRLVAVTGTREPERLDQITATDFGALGERISQLGQRAGIMGEVGEGVATMDPARILDALSIGLDRAGAFGVDDRALRRRIEELEQRLEELERRSSSEN